MGAYVLVTRVNPEQMGTVERLHEIDDLVRGQVSAHYPGVRWVTSYALLGPFDFLDIFEAPDDATAAHVRAIVQSFGYVSTEMWTAVPRERLRRPVTKGGARGAGEAKGGTRER
ncbi:GYD domain-containing protein [Candidatus Binatia bacterium]|nr:GYD domain-containing protein [Candidatus Binatia bacterium]